MLDSLHETMLIVESIVVVALVVGIIATVLLLAASAIVGSHNPIQGERR